MERTDLIPAHDFCTHYHISYTFITGLRDAGLVEIITVEEEPFLHTDQLGEIEKLIRLHTDLEINAEGIEAISHLLERMKELQLRLRALQQRLQLYERDSSI